MTAENPNFPQTEIEAPQAPLNKSNNQDWLRFFAETIRTIIIVLLLAYALRLLVLQPFVVEGASMYPKFSTNDYLIVDKLSYRFVAPQRGDIIVFKYPNKLTVNYVKRIIGLPGEKVVIENGKVKIVNTEHPAGYYLDETAYLDSTTTVSPVVKNEFTVSADHYFVMGDNRPNSSDSRSWGLLPKEDVIGRVVIQAYPLSDISLIAHARY